MIYYIYVYYQGGNIGPHQVEVLDCQPKEGFNSEKEAELFLIDKINKKQGYFFDRDWYHFTILKTFKSKSAV